jgi:hypothetical protein
MTSNCCYYFALEMKGRDLLNISNTNTIYVEIHDYLRISTLRRSECDIKFIALHE